MMNYFELVPLDFKNQMNVDENAVLIDVREEYEYEDENIGGINIPMGEVLSRVNDLKDSASIYLCCRSGKRSRAIALHLSKHVAPVKVYSLAGGIEAYKQL